MRASPGIARFLICDKKGLFYGLNYEALQSISSDQVNQCINGSSTTILMRVAFEHKNSAMFNKLIDMGADFRSKNKNQENIFHILAKYNDFSRVEFVNILLSTFALGLEYREVTTDKLTPLELSKSFENNIGANLFKTVGQIENCIRHINVQSYKSGNPFPCDMPKELLIIIFTYVFEDKGKELGLGDYNQKFIRAIVEGIYNRLLPNSETKIEEAVPTYQVAEINRNKNCCSIS